MGNPMEESRQPHPIDVIVGGRIRVARLARDMSQGALAEVIGVTFQQVQKYENGSNRVSASKLVEIATTLQTPASSFLAGLGGSHSGSDCAPGEDSDVPALLDAYRRLPSDVRTTIAEFVQGLAASRS